METAHDYIDFLKNKIDIAPKTGFKVSPDAIHPALMPHQRDSVVWALEGGRRALFESFGLGKTEQELEYCRLAAKHAGGRALIVLPLGVRPEFVRDAVNLLDMERPAYVRTAKEIREARGDILLTNYERVDCTALKIHQQGGSDEKHIPCRENYRRSLLQKEVFSSGGHADTRGLCCGLPCTPTHVRPGV